MSLLAKFIIFIIIFIFSVKNLFASDIPIIVIAPSKKAQSISTVGTSTAVYDAKYIENTNDFFLGDVLSNESTSFNFFQTGGHGTNSGIQLRGLPKRYSTVYIDGVKMSDPSSPSNDFYFDHILKNQISRVEILKGNQSSVYGSGAIGGTINITTKRGRPGFQKDISYNTASHGTHNLAFSLSGANEKNDFYFGLERFITNGISAMNDNSEKDGYKNNTLVANYGHKFTDKLKFESNIRLADAFLQYDTVDDRYNDNNTSNILEVSANASLIYIPNQKFTNRITYAETNIDRKYNTYADAQDEYEGDRKALTYFGNYNINLDSSVVFGLGTEFDQMWKSKVSDRYNGKEGLQANSAYIDYQKRFTNNLYATLGTRLEEHSLVGKEDAQRVTLAYLFDDKTTKIKSSFGTGFRFPTINEAYFDYYSHPANRKILKAEKSKSFDVGFEKSFLDLGLNIDISYFNIKYIDAIESWQDNTQGSGVAWSTLNSPGTTKSQGLELLSKWKINDALNFDFNYTYTSTYDGAEQDDPNKNSDYYNSQMVRVPRHFLNLSTKYFFLNKNLNLTLHTKASSEARDYGNVNRPESRTYEDVRLHPYLINDLSLNYNLFDTYRVFFDIKNIFDKKYETALQYSQMDRSFNFGIKRRY